MADTDADEPIETVEPIEEVEPVAAADAGGPSEPLDPRDEETPAGMTSKPTAVLIALNLLAVCGFGFLLYLDLMKRQEWARAVFMRDLAILGLPVDDQDWKTNAEAGTQARHSLESAELKKAYKDRGGKLGDKFQGLRENFKAEIRSADLDEDILARHFTTASAGKPVPTLKAEVERLKSELPAKITAVAKDVAAKAKDKTADEKRDLIRKILFPLCIDGEQAVKVDQKINDTPDDKLGGLLASAAERRMLWSILQPLEIFRASEYTSPPDPAKVADPKFKASLVDRAADLGGVTVAKLLAHFAKRCDDVLADTDWIYGMKRDNTEKRRTIAFLLANISNVEIPGADRQQAPENKGKDKDVDQPEGKGGKQPPARPWAFGEVRARAEAVCGLRDFNVACEDLAVVTEIQEDRTVQAIQRDLGTFQYLPGLRLSSPVRLANELVTVLNHLEGVVIPKEDDFKTAVQEKLKGLQGKLNSADALVAELKKIIEGQQVAVPQSSQPALEQSLNALVSTNAMGFLGKHQMTLDRLQELALLAKVRQDNLTQLEADYKTHAAMLEARIQHENSILDELVKSRADTQKQAALLQELQQELFIAQVNLAGAHAYNLYLAQRLVHIEKTKATGGSPR